MRDYVKEIQQLTDVGLIDVAETGKPVCTCREDSKQRALCPVCDKEEYDTMKKFVKSVKNNTNSKYPIYVKNETIKCPECCCEVSQEELDMFGGLCENCGVSE